MALDKLKLKEVTSVKLFRNIEHDYVDQNGLLSEKIFGSRRAYRCGRNCEDLMFRKHKGKVCSKCGVAVTSNNARYNYFGKITIPFNIIKDTKKKKFQQLFKNKEFNHILDPKRNDISSSVKTFLKYDKFDPNKLEMTKDFDPYNCVPLNITGIYSLYIALKVASNYINNSKALEYINYFFDELLVIPPYCRQSVRVGGVKPEIVVSDIDDIYRKILYLKKALINIPLPEEELAQAKEVNEIGRRPEKIKEQELKQELKTKEETLKFKKKFDEFYDMVENTIKYKMIDYVDDTEIQSLDEAASVMQYRCDSLYDHIKNQLSGKEGLIRKDFLGKNIDFSSRAVIIPDPTLDTYQIKISKQIFIKLWMIEYSRWLWKIKETPHEKIRFFVRSTDIHDGYLEHIDEFIEYFFNNSSQKERLCFVNRQPTLWRYSLPTVEIIGITEDNVIRISPLIVKPMAADFDGDTYP